MTVSTIRRRTLGKTGLEVTILGFGAAELGHEQIGRDECARVLEGVLDMGINVIDTAHCYEDSESKIGRALGHRRDEFVLVSKCGHSRGKLESPSWTPQAIRESVEMSLDRLNTDHLDVLLLHSCSVKDLGNDDLIGALVRAKEAGKTRFVGYSGDAEPAELAVTMDVFDCLETSVNIVDQQVLDRYLPAAREANLGVLAKRTIANAAWKGVAGRDSFYSDYVRPYVERLETMSFTPESLGFEGSWVELALRFSVYQDGVHCAIVGGTNLEHIRENTRIIEKGPLPEDAERRLRDLWRQHDDGSWVGQV